MGDNWIVQDMALSQERAPEFQGVQRGSKELRGETVTPAVPFIYAFADYQLNASERRLSCADKPLPLPPKAFDLLLVLVEHAGQLVEKEYLLHSVWPDSFVEEANIGVYISALRKVFTKTSLEHDFIETIPKWGYRFTASVTKNAPAVNFTTSASGSDPTAPLPVSLPVDMHPAVPPAIRKSLVVRLLISVFVASAVLTLLLLLPRFSHKANKVSANTRPLIGLPGFFSQPAFSLDGQKLAYAWRAGGDPYQSIYVQGVSSDDRMRLTDTGGDDFSPAWSPKSPEIAFLHSSGNALEIAIVNTQTPALRRKLTTISGVASSFRIPPSLAWSPDNTSLLTTDSASDGDSPSLVLVSVESGKKRPLTHAPTRMVDDDGAFSPDGSMIAFRRELGDSSDVVYVIPANGGQERRLTFDPGPIDGLAWSPDGQSVILSSGRATSVGNIWRVPLNGGPAVAITTPLAHTSSPTVSSVAHRLAYIDSPNNVSVWRLAIDAKSDPERFITSNFFDSSAHYSPDGHYIAFRSDRSGTNEIWVCRSDGREPRRITHFNGPMTGSPQWSPDSRSLAFDSRVSGRADIYVIDIAGGSPARITNGIADNSDNVVPSWSRDGLSLYFSSNRTGQWQVWRKPLNGGAESQVTLHGGFNGTESQDGSSLYYVHDANKTSLWRVSLRSGKEKQVLEALDPGMWGTWTIDKNKIFYMKKRHSAGEPADIFRMDLTSGATETLGRTQNVVNGGISISPDGRWMTFAQNDGNRSSTIMIMDGWE
jgi:Tol biopolymer transport system component/DNA-binding winged helix-turn-helix (wHTH) protein